jgi:hypothetical protein
LLLQVTAQFEFELAQWFDDCLLDVCGSCSVAFHAAVGESFELFDHFVEAAGAESGSAPLASQVLSFAETFTDFGG